MIESSVSMNLKQHSGAHLVKYAIPCKFMKRVLREFPSVGPHYKHLPGSKLQRHFTTLMPMLTMINKNTNDNNNKLQCTSSTLSCYHIV